MNTNVYRNQDGQFVIRSAEPFPFFGDSAGTAPTDERIFPNFQANYALEIALLVQAVYCPDLSIDEVLSALVIAPCASALTIEPARS